MWSGTATTPSTAGVPIDEYGSPKSGGLPGFQRFVQSAGSTYPTNARANHYTALSGYGTATDSWNTYDTGTITYAGASAPATLSGGARNSRTTATTTPHLPASSSLTQCKFKSLFYLYILIRKYNFS